MTRLHLHIGANKTGTTALQSLLARSGGALREVGILYPETGRGRPGAGGFAHIDLAAALGFGRPAGPLKNVPGLRDSLADEIAASGCRDVVVSAEYFMLRRDTAPVAAFFGGYETRVVVYLRRHDSWVEALIGQALKTVPNPDWEISAEGFIRHQMSTRGQHIDYLELLNAWSDSFGRRNIVVRPYEKQQNRPNLMADFLTAIGRPDAIPAVHPEDFTLNESLPGPALMLIRRVRSCGLPDGAKDLLIRSIEAGARGARGASILSPEVRRELVERYAHQYARIAREFLDRPDGRLYFEPPCPDDPKFSAPEIPGLWQSAGYILRGMLRSGGA